MALWKKLALLATLLPTPCLGASLQQSDLQALGLDGSLCRGFDDKKIKNREKEEQKFLQSLQVLHRKYPKTQPLIAKQNNLLKKGWAARSQACKRIKGTEKRVESFLKATPPKGESCHAFKEHSDFLRLPLRELLQTRRELQKDWDDLTLTDSNYYVENKEAVLASKEQAGKNFQNLSQEMRQIYVHSTGTLMRPIQQGISWEINEMNLKIDRLVAQISELEERTANCHSHGR